jgi:hypothetical protein
MHFFRIKIKRHRTQRRPSLTNNDQEASPAISGRNIRERRFQHNDCEILSGDYYHFVAK